MQKTIVTSTTGTGLHRDVQALVTMPGGNSNTLTTGARKVIVWHVWNCMELSVSVYFEMAEVESRAAKYCLLH